MKPILQVRLPKIGYVHSMPRAIVHSPLKLVGLNMPNLYTEQLLTQILMLLQYGLQTAETTGVLIWASVETMKLEMGLVGELMQTPELFELVITETWLKQIWLDCLWYNLQIQTNLPEFKPNCSNDIELM